MEMIPIGGEDSYGEGTLETMAMSKRLGHDGEVVRGGEVCEVISNVGFAELYTPSLSMTPSWIFPCHRFP